MSQFARMRSILERITYKPEWRFEVTSMAPTLKVQEAFNLYICFAAQNVEKQSERIFIGSNTILSSWEIEPLSDKEIVDRIISHKIRKMEEHEFMEWLKLDGFCVRDPHSVEGKDGTH